MHTVVLVFLALCSPDPPAERYEPTREHVEDILELLKKERRSRAFLVRRTMEYWGAEALPIIADVVAQVDDAWLLHPGLELLSASGEADAFLTLVRLREVRKKRPKDTLYQFVERHYAPAVERFLEQHPSPAQEVLTPMVEAARRGLEEGPRGVREACFDVLELLKLPETVPDIIEAHEKRWVYQRKALLLLGEIGTEEAQHFLTDVVREERGHEWPRAVEGLGRADCLEALDLVLGKLDPEDRGQWNFVVSGLGAFRSPRAAAKLIEISKGDHVNSQHIALVALGGTGEASAIERLFEALEDRDLQGVALRGLSKVHEPAVARRIEEPLWALHRGVHPFLIDPHTARVAKPMLKKLSRDLRSEANLIIDYGYRFVGFGHPDAVAEDALVHAFDKVEKRPSLQELIGIWKTVESSPSVTEREETGPPRFFEFTETQVVLVVELPTGATTTLDPDTYEYADGLLDIPGDKSPKVEVRGEGERLWLRQKSSRTGWRFVRILERAQEIAGRERLTARQVGKKGAGEYTKVPASAKSAARAFARALLDRKSAREKALPMVLEEAISETRRKGNGYKLLRRKFVQAGARGFRVAAVLPVLSGETREVLRSVAHTHPRSLGAWLQRKIVDARLRVFRERLTYGIGFVAVFERLKDKRHTLLFFVLIEEEKTWRVTYAQD